MLAMILLASPWALGQHGRHGAAPKKPAASSAKTSAKTKGKKGGAIAAPKKGKEKGKEKSKGKGKESGRNQAKASQRGKGAKTAAANDRSSGKRGRNGREAAATPRRSGQADRSRSTAAAPSRSRSSSASNRSQPATPAPPRNAPPRTAPPRNVVQRPSSPAAESVPADLAEQARDGAPAGSSARSKRMVPPPPPISGDQFGRLSGNQPEMPGTTVRGYPGSLRTDAGTRPFHAEGSIGLFATGSLRAGYQGAHWPYDYALEAGFNGSNGHVDNASATRLTVGARGGYVIGSDYGIFSGGYMGADANYRSEHYRRYAVAAAPERSIKAWDAAVDGRNSNGGLSFDLHGGYRAFDLSDSSTGSETSLDGSAKVRMEWSRLAAGGEVDLRLTNLSGTSITAFQLRGYGRYAFGPATLRAGVGLGVAKNTDGSSSSVVSPMVELNLYPMAGVTLAAGLDGGLTQTTLRGLATVNPWITPMPSVRHPIERIAYKAAVRIEPDQSFALRVSAARSSFDDYLSFHNGSDALYSPAYGAASVTRVVGDVYWEPGAHDMVGAQATMLAATLDSSGQQAPYVPKIDGELIYVRRLTGLPLSLTASLRYIAARSAETGPELAPVALAGLKANYSLTRQIYLTLELANLADVKYELWPGYRERGIFAAIGAGASF